MKFTVKNILVMFIFVILAVVIGKWLGNKVPAVGKITNMI